MTDHLGFDFGTSNTAVAYRHEDVVRVAQLGHESATIPTSVFFDPEGAFTIGEDANRHLIEGDDGRYMRAMKSVLGTPLMQEARHIYDTKTDLYEIIARFIAHVKARAEAEAGRRFSRVNAGRPVFFHKSGDAKEAAAARDLERCFKMAGFETLTFTYEPEAAARKAVQVDAADSTGVIVDIGGGTSDFTVFRLENGAMTILGAHGIRLGGTDFDKLLSFTHIMPELGRGRAIKKGMGPEAMPAPNHIYSSLSTWEKIAFIYEPKTFQLARALRRDAVDPVYFERLLAVLEAKLGHDLAFRAEGAKIASNSATGEVRLDLDLMEKGLALEIAPALLDALFAPFGTMIEESLREAIHTAGLTPEEIDLVIPVGGSSSMRCVQAAIKSTLPLAQWRAEMVFTSIATGLAL